ncbi:MAG: hypothetical protein MR828_08280 [Clostridiales bacterium]|nr:hypothetical protein [Clostridiales bacterium]
MKQKYLEDYRIHTTVDAGGKIRDTAEYIGPLFCFVQPRRERLPGQITALVGACAEAALLLLPLLQRNRLSSVFYAVLPHIVTLVPLWFSLRSILLALCQPEPLTREQADTVATGCQSCPGFALALSGAAVLGCCLWLLLFARGQAVGNDWIFLCCDLLAFGTNLVLLKTRGSFATVVRSEP